MKPYRDTARMAQIEHIFVGIPQGLVSFPFSSHLIPGGSQLAYQTNRATTNISLRWFMMHTFDEGQAKITGNRIRH